MTFTEALDELRATMCDATITPDERDRMVIAMRDRIVRSILADNKRRTNRILLDASRKMAETN